MEIILFVAVIIANIVQHNQTPKVKPVEHCVCLQCPEANQGGLKETDDLRSR